MTKERTCRRCGKTFVSKRNAVICSDCRVGICAVCGAEFRRIGEAPYIEWCSKDCREVYYKQHGFSPQGMRYKPKKCKICGEEFIPKTPHDSYCGKDHFRPCPVCGKPVKFSYLTEPIKGCSKECRNEIFRRTCIDRLGVDNPAKAEEVKDKLRDSFRKRHPETENYKESDTYKKYVATNRLKYGYDFPHQSPEFQKEMQERMFAKTGYRTPVELPQVRKGLDEYMHDPVKAREVTLARTATKNRCSASDGTPFDSSYEVDVYEFCKRNNIPVEIQIYTDIYNGSGRHSTMYDFRIDGKLYECKGGHLLDGCWDNTSVSIQDKVNSYVENGVILITDIEEGFPALESKFRSDVVAIDIEIFRVLHSTGYKDNSRYRSRFKNEQEIWNILHDMLNQGKTRILLEDVVSYAK